MEQKIALRPPVHLITDTSVERARPHVTAGQAGALRTKCRELRRFARKGAGGDSPVGHLRRRSPFTRPQRPNRARVDPAPLSAGVLTRLTFVRSRAPFSRDAGTAIFVISN
jgi:hypothetical protein